MILVVSFTFLGNLLSHCNSSVCPFGVLPNVTHVRRELVLSNNVSPLVSSCVFHYLVSVSWYVGSVSPYCSTFATNVFDMTSQRFSVPY